jgi:Sulfotransferase domain
MPSLKNKLLSWMNQHAPGMVSGYRHATWQSRALPDFIIIGAQKAGTTSLHKYLLQHPQIVQSLKKEVHFFDGGLDQGVDNFEKGTPWYSSHFPLRKNMKAGQKTFEATPSYLFNPPAPKRIYDLIPQVKLISLLRNPTERAISHYFQEKRKGMESLPMLEAFEAEETRLKSCIVEKDYKSDVFRCYSYKSRGLYKEQLERYYERFPREQILVIPSEEFFVRPDTSLAEVFEFIGVDKEFKIADLKPRNVASNRFEIEPKVYEYLNNFFLPHNQALYELVGQNYGW